MSAIDKISTQWAQWWWRCYFSMFKHVVILSITHLIETWSHLEQGPNQSEENKSVTMFTLPIHLTLTITAVKNTKMAAFKIVLKYTVNISSSSNECSALDFDKVTLVVYIAKLTKSIVCVSSPVVDNFIVPIVENVGFFSGYLFFFCARYQL
jgi:hypothetical protein